MSMPIHPALVHLPLALAVVVPVVATGLTWALWKGRLPSRAWLSVVVLQAVMLVSGLIAMQFGEREEARLKSKISAALLEEHDETADQFLWVAGFTLGAAGLVLVLHRPRAVRAMAVTTVIGSVLAAGAAVRAGHSGGELVYLHNAGAYGNVTPQNSNGPQSSAQDGNTIPKKKN